MYVYLEKNHEKDFSLTHPNGYRFRFCVLGFSILNSVEWKPYNHEIFLFVQLKLKCNEANIVKYIKFYITCTLRVLNFNIT